jgi:uncharacterized protein
MIRTAPVAAKHFTLALAGIAAAALAPIPAVAQTAPAPQANRTMTDTQSPLLSFSITEEMRAAPDRASIGAGVTTTATTAVEAMRANATASTAMNAALRRAGIAARDIQTSGISLQPQYDYTPQQQGQPPRLIGYQVTNQVRVTTTDIARIGPLLDAIVAAGGTNIDGPTFTIANPDAMLDTARTTALRRAGERAALYARAAGFRSAELVAVSEGGGMMPMPMPTMARMAAAEAAPTPVQPGEVANAITLNVQYRMVR